MKNKNSRYIYIALLYGLLIIDNSLIYILEFSDNLYQFYDANFLLYTIMDLIYLGIIIVLRLLIARVTTTPMSKREIGLFTGLTLLIAGLAHFTSEEVGEEVVFIAFCLALIYLSMYLKTTVKDSRQVLRNARIVMIISIFGIMESIFYWYQATYSTAVYGFGFLYRYIAFDVLKLMICLIGLQYLLKSMNDLFEHKSHDDKLKEFCTQYELTVRQKEIIALVIEGHSNKEIGQLLNITEGTVKTHIYNIFKKSDITSRNQLMQRVNKQ